MKGSGGGYKNYCYLYLVFYLKSTDFIIGNNCSFFNNSATLGAGYLIILIIIKVLFTLFLINLTKFKLLLSWLMLTFNITVVALEEVLLSKI